MEFSIVRWVNTAQSTPMAERAQAPAELPPLPADVGLTWRPLTPDDVGSWLILVNTSEEFEGSGERTSAEQLSKIFQGTWRDPELDTIGGFDSDGSARAYALSDYRAVTSGTLAPSLQGTVHPDHRRRGIGTALLAWSESRARQQLAATDSVLPARLRIFLRDDQGSTGTKAIAERAGYRPIRWYFDMLRDLNQPLPDARLPDDLTVGPLAPDRYDDLRIVHNEHFAPDHWGSSPFTAELWQLAVVSGEGFRPEWSFLAIDPSDRIAGYAISKVYEQDWTPNGYRDAWTNILGVRRDQRGRGVGAALLALSMQTFKDAGMEYATIGVDADNPTGALALYTKLGYTKRQSHVLYSKELI